MKQQDIMNQIIEDLYDFVPKGWENLISFKIYQPSIEKEQKNMIIMESLETFEDILDDDSLDFLWGEFIRFSEGKTWGILLEKEKGEKNVYCGYWTVGKQKVLRIMLWFEK